jgi:hypothetical protein
MNHKKERKKKNNKKMSILKYGSYSPLPYLALLKIVLVFFSELDVTFTK